MIVLMTGTVPFVTAPSAIEMAAIKATLLAAQSPINRPAMSISEKMKVLRLPSLSVIFPETTFPSMWWLAALLTTGVGPLLYLGVWKKMFFSPILAPNRMWPENFTNVIMVWGLLTAGIGILLTILTHLTTTKKLGASLESYGLRGPGEGFPLGKVLKSLLWAAVTLLPIYLCLLFVEAVWKVDFRLWIIALLPMTAPRFSAFLGYLVPFAIICAYQAVLLMGLLRVNEGKASLGREMVINSLVLTLGALVWLAILYIPLAAGSPIVFASDPIGATAAGMKKAMN